MMRVWDLFVRLSHWLVVFFVILAWVTANFGDAEYKWHSWNGYMILIIVLSRIIWGIVGSTSARFSHFIRSPRIVFHYLVEMFRGRGPIFIGHNPAGGWMVLVLLLTLLLQAGTGMFASDDILAEGPFAYLVKEKTVSMMTGLHYLIFDFLVVFVILHIVAVIYHQFFKKEKLIEAMFSGRKENLQSRANEKLFFKPFYFALVIFGLVMFIFGFVLNYYT